MSAKFPVYSIAKPFLAEAILHLGIPLAHPIGNYLKNIAQIYASRTIASLLNHTSGLADYSFLTEYNEAVAKRETAWSRDELLERCEKFPHSHEGFQYSNIGYLLLRMLLEQETNLSMFEAIKKLVLDPLSITGFEEWDGESDLVPGYDPKWVYSGTFVATKESIESGFLALAKHRASTIGLGTGLAEVPYPNTGFDSTGYSYGFMCDGNPEPKYVGHGGGGPGFSHMILVNTGNWKVAIESSTTEFNQTEAIGRLKEKLS
ncbi:MAG: hypothetical protein RL612_585 [Actinomycetota bacterium]|jgi:CubicO group peptidase (beta-lactamase class C family)